MTLTSIKNHFSKKGLIIKSIDLLKEVGNSKVFKIILVTGLVIIITVTLSNIFSGGAYLPVGEFTKNLLQSLSTEGKELFQFIDPEVVKEGASFFLK